MMPVGGTLVVDVGHLLFGAALALAFAVLTRPGEAGVREAARAQSAVVAAAAAWQAWADGSATAGALAPIVLVGGAGVLPWVFRDTPGHASPATPHIPHTPIAVAAAAALVVVGILVVLPAHTAGVAALRDNLALAVPTVLVALFILAARQGAARIAGLWTLANGVALAGSLVESPVASAGVAGLFALVAAGAIVRPAGAP